MCGQARIAGVNGLRRLILPVANVAEVKKQQQEKERGPQKGRKRKRGMGPVEAVGVATLWDAIREYATIDGETGSICHYHARGRSSR